MPKGEIHPTKRKPPHIAISDNGRLCLSTAAVELLTHKYGYEYAFLFWDDEAEVLAVRPTKKKDARAYRITYSSNGRNAAISARSLCDLIGYDYSQHRSFMARWNHAEAGFEIDLQVQKVKTVPINSSQTAKPKLPEISSVELATWYTKAEALKRRRIAKRTLERFVQEGRIERRWRPRPGGRGEPVYNPTDVDAPVRRNRPGRPKKTDGQKGGVSRVPKEPSLQSA